MYESNSQHSMANCLPFPKATKIFIKFSQRNGNRRQRIALHITKDEMCLIQFIGNPSYARISDGGLIYSSFQTMESWDEGVHELHVLVVSYPTRAGQESTNARIFQM